MVHINIETLKITIEISCASVGNVFKSWFYGFDVIDNTYLMLLILRIWCYWY